MILISNKRKVLLFFIIVISFQTFAQEKKLNCCLSENELIGIWQRDSEIVGSGLIQHFQFFKNKNFELNLGDLRDDARSLIQLKGKYRLLGDELYFTITSRSIVEGKIGIDDPGLSLNIFSIENGKIKEMPEPDPKEIRDPCYITVITKNHIKLNNEEYFKINESQLK